MKRLHINIEFTLRIFAILVENFSSTFKKLILPLLYLVGLDIKLLGKLFQDLFNANSSKRHF